MRFHESSEIADFLGLCVAGMGGTPMLRGMSLDAGATCAARGVPCGSMMSGRAIQSRLGMVSQLSSTGVIVASYIEGIDAARSDSVAFLWSDIFGPFIATRVALLLILMRVLGRLLGSSDDAHLIAGIVISNLSLLIAIGFIHAITCEIFSILTDRRAVWYVLICPATLYLSAVYPMSLMLAIGSAAIYFARRDKWELASAIAMLAPLARRTPAERGANGRHGRSHVSKRLPSRHRRGGIEVIAQRHLDESIGIERGLVQ
jgi:hypothetical protein